MDRQGYIWASEAMWRAMDAEGISRVMFRSEIRPMTPAEKGRAEGGFRQDHDLATGAAQPVVCAAAVVEAGRDTLLGRLLDAR